MATVISYVKRNSPGGCWGTEPGHSSAATTSSARLAQNGISIHVVGLCPARDERAEADEPRELTGLPGNATDTIEAKPDRPSLSGAGAEPVKNLAHRGGVDTERKFLAVSQRW